MSTAVTSVRTAEEPMAFTTGEFFRGALSAWLWFLGMSTLGFALFFLPALPVVLLYTVPISFIALIAGLGPAYLIGQSLRRFATESLHLAAFTAYGLVFGTGATAATLALLGGNYAGGWIFWVIPILGSTAAIPLGWLRGSRDARRDAVVRNAPVPERSTAT